VNCWQFFRTFFAEFRLHLGFGRSEAGLSQCDRGSELRWRFNELHDGLSRRIAGLGLMM